MVARLVGLAVAHKAAVAVLAALLVVSGGYAFYQLDIVAYPDPSAPMIEVITQNPSLSAEEMERQITLPIEYGLAAMPGLTTIRSISLFGLSDVRFYFDYDTEYFRDRQEVLSRLAFLNLPTGVQPAISPWWALAEVFRYQLTGKDVSLTDLKTIQDWQLNREFKRVPGVIDVTAFGGTTKQYHVELDPGLLFAYSLGVPEVLSAIRNSNANAGGNYLTVGSQSLDVRGVGLIRDLDDIETVVISEKEGTPILLKNVGSVSTGYKVRLGKVGIDEQEDAVEGVVLLMRGYQSLPVIERVKAKVEELNHGKLPSGVTITPVYDRGRLIHTTIETIEHILITGIAFVSVALFLFIGHFRTAIIVVLAIPLALLFTFIMMVLLGQSANLISLGAIDFGIIVDSTLLMVENVFFQITRRRDQPVPIEESVTQAAHDVGKPIFFATAIIIIAFAPLFTMAGVSGRIFSPMSLTYGFALTGALLTAFTVAPVLCVWLLKGQHPDKDTRLVSWIRQRYLQALSGALDRERLVLFGAAGLFLAAIGMWFTIGGEFMPALEEGNIWLRATMPTGVSFEEGSRLASDMRSVFRQYPEVRTAVSQLGRPDDGTDPTGFFNSEFFVDLKPRNEWRSDFKTKEDLVSAISRELDERFPGITLNFSQIIQDNVEEAMTGVKGANSVKLFGPDLEVLESKAAEIQAVLKRIRGVADLGVLHSLGQPNLLIEVDRQATARYGLEVNDVNAVVQAAVGGQSVTQVFEGDKWFDLVVRFQPQFRRDPEAIRDIQVTTTEGVRIPLKQLALIKESIGSFMIYRENNQRYIPIKFSVRGRDLESAVEEASRAIDSQVELPEGYHLGWYGEYSQLQAEKQRLMKIVPISLFVILCIVAYAVGSLKDALLVLASVPFALVGGIFALFITGTPFSISAAVGFLSVFGVSIQGALVSISRQHEYFKEGTDPKKALMDNAAVRMRPVMMTTLSAAIGLVPAAVATGIGAQAQQPLARVVVGGMLSAMVMILFVLPVLYGWAHRRNASPAAGTVPLRRVALGLCLMVALSGCQNKDEAGASVNQSDDPHRIVRVNPKAQQEIESQPTRLRALSAQLTIQGRLQYSPDHYVNISSPLSGWVREVHGKLGEPVKQDQPLATIESPDILTEYTQLTRAEADRDLARRSHAMAVDLYRAKALPKRELQQAENDLKRAETDYQRNRERLLLLKVPAAELDQPPSKRSITGRFILKSTLDGVIVDKKVSVGQLVDQNAMLFTVANLDTLQAIGEIYERDLPAVKPGQAVAITMESVPEQQFHGYVRHVGDVVDATNRTVKIRCDVDNPEHKLKVDVFARIAVELNAPTTVLAVPRKAVIQVAEKSFLFVQRSPDEYERREVVLGPVSGDLVVVRDGLNDGDVVVGTGSLLLQSALEKQVT